jgi:hypothetical protein
MLNTVLAVYRYDGLKVQQTVRVTRDESGLSVIALGNASVMVALDNANEAKLRDGKTIFLPYAMLSYVDGSPLLKEARPKTASRMCILMVATSQYRQKPEDRVLAKGDDFTLVVTSSHIPVKANFVSD